MPKSKRNRLVSLTQTRKKPFGETKASLVNEIHECVDEYARIFVFRVDNMRNAKLKELRTEMRFSRFFFGKNKIMSIALGRTESEEYKEGLSQIARALTGQCGLLFTNQSRQEVMKYFDAYRDKDFARTGDVATETVQLYAGPLAQFPHNLEPYLRELGMPTSLQKGVVTLLQDFEVCHEGEPLTSEQARLLKLLDNRMAEFRVKIDAMWCKKDGTFESFAKDDANDDDEEEDLMSEVDEEEDD